MFFWEICISLLNHQVSGSHSSLLEKIVIQNTSKNNTFVDSDMIRRVSISTL